MSASYTFDTITSLCESLKTAGFNENDINNLIRFNELKKIKDVVNKKAFVFYWNHVINTNDDPTVPFDDTHNRLKIYNSKQGLIKLSPSDLGGIFLEEIFGNKNLNTEFLNIDKIFNNFLEKRFASAAILDYLLDHSDAIPNSWKDKFIVFPGTIYCEPDRAYVRYLYCCKGQKIWKSDHHPLDMYLKNGLYENSFNAVLE